MTDPTPNLIEEKDGDIVVPDYPDSLGWQNYGPGLPESDPTEYYDYVADQFSDTVDTVTESKNGEVIDEPSKRRVRQNRLLDSEGFFATSPGALVRATGMTRQDIKTSPAPGAKYISIVIQRQMNLPSKPDDPNAAGRAVTSEIGEYASRARGDIAALNLLTQVLGTRNDPEIKPDSAITSIRNFKDWKHEGLLFRAVADIKRLSDTYKFVDGKGPDPFEDKYSRSDKESMARLEDFIDTLTFQETLDLVKDLHRQHQREMAFFVERLKEIEKFSSGRVIPVAKRALTGLGITRPE